MNFTPFGGRMDAAGRIKPDFRALVALHAAAQAAQPSARLATRLAMGNDSEMKIAESLIALFAPSAPGEDSRFIGQGQVLKGCFNPSVPNSHIPLTLMKAW